MSIEPRSSLRKLIVVGALAIAGAIPVTASAQGPKSDVQGFGGVTVGTATFGSAVSSTFGGRVGIGLTPYLQVIGEAGRLADIRSPLPDFLGISGASVHVSAFYGEGGVRFIASPRSAVCPYGEATAGVARLNGSLSGLGGSTDTIVDEALSLINSTRPALGAGGGVIFDAGPMAVDIGYRYKQISAGNNLAAFLNRGKDYRINQVRVGLGVRF